MNKNFVTVMILVIFAFLYTLNYMDDFELVFSIRKGGIEFNCDDIYDYIVSKNTSGIKEIINVRLDKDCSMDKINKLMIELSKKLYENFCTEFAFSHQSIEFGECLKENDDMNQRVNETKFLLYKKITCID